VRRLVGRAVLLAALLSLAVTATAAAHGGVAVSPTVVG
jgi:hypothetical protein